MKKNLIALAILGAFAGAALAQSNVTLYGVVDVNIRGVNNSGTGGTRSSLGDDGINSARFGVRGVEQLGGGWSAGFTLEMDVNPDTGTVNATKVFSRQATVSLLGPIGEIRLGRHYTPTGWNTFEFDPWSVIGVGGSSAIARYASGPAAQPTYYRADNAVHYYLPPNMGGIYGQATYAFGEGTPNGRYAGARLGYGAGPINVAAAYGVQDLQATGGTDGEYTIKSLGVSYRISIVRLLGSYELGKLTTNFGPLAAFAGEERRWLVGTIVTVGSGEIRASYADSNGRDSTAPLLAQRTTFNNADATLMTLGYIHNLSRRTAVYAAVARIDNDGTGTFSIPGGAAGITPGGTSNGYMVGVRHLF